MTQGKDYTGYRHGKLTFTHRIASAHGKTHWAFRCDCGAEGDVRADRIPHSKKSCGCTKRVATVPSSRLRDYTGMRIGMMNVIRRAPNIGSVAAWECECDCGNTNVIRASSLAKGQNSCGCSKAKFFGQKAKVHGESLVNGNPTLTYKSWGNMKIRCYNENGPDYENYGGRGIYVCGRWRESFIAFRDDMGDRPSRKHSIDRFPDNDGSYTCGKHDLCDDCREKNAPPNCRWATPSQQMRNTRCNRMITAFGQTLSAAEWSDRTGVNLNAIYRRINQGWSPTEALTTAPNKRRVDPDR